MGKCGADALFFYFCFCEFCGRMGESDGVVIGHDVAGRNAVGQSRARRDVCVKDVSKCSGAEGNWMVPLLWSSSDGAFYYFKRGVKNE